MLRALPMTFAVLLSGALVLSESLYAMEIQKFDKMAGPDQDEYIVILVQGSQKVLKEAGRPEDAAKVHKPFTTNDDNGIVLPKSFRAVSKDFKPKHPPKEEKK
jgi:hypothetical protein